MVTVPNNATIKGYISDGTASATAGDATITFLGVSVALFAQADIFVQTGYSGVIFGIDTDANTVTLQQPWAGPTSSAAAYDVVLIPQSTELAETTRRMMEALQGSLLSIVNMTPEDGQTLVWQDGQWVAHDPYTDVAFGGDTQFDAITVLGTASIGGLLTGTDADFSGDVTVAGTLTVGSMSLASLALTGDLTGTTAEFTGAISAASATLAGDLHAASGFFTGNLSAAALTLSALLTGTAANFSGDLSAHNGAFGGTLGVVGLLTGAGVNLSGDLAAHNGGFAGTLGCAGGFTGGAAGMFTGKLTVNHSTLVGQMATSGDLQLPTGPGTLARLIDIAAPPGLLAIPCRNKIINGDFRVDQYGLAAGRPGVPAGDTYMIDRWRFDASFSGVFEMTRNIGGWYELLCTSDAVHALASGDIFAFHQVVEGLNCADMLWGIPTALPVSLSFQVWCDVAGTYGGSIINHDSTRSFPFSYNVPVAATWTSIVITIPGDVAGSWTIDNGVGLVLYFGLGVGSQYSAPAGAWTNGVFLSCNGAQNLMTAVGNKFYIRTIQLELAPPGASPSTPVASAFDRRQYGTELMLCQRYFQSFTYQPGNFLTVAQCYGAAGSAVASFELKTPMRAPPTATIPTTGSGEGQINLLNSAGSAAPSGSIIVGATDPYKVRLQGQNFNGLNAGDAAAIGMGGTTGATLSFSAEL